MELERQLKEMKSGMSPLKAIEIAENIFEINAILPNSKRKITKTLLLTDEQRELAELFNFGC